MPSTGSNNKTNVHHGPEPPFVLIPLYIYPTAKGKTWAPLFEVVKIYQDVSFVIIVNPDSGPGRGSRPDVNYIAVLEALTKFDNVTILGYVAVCWAERDITDVSRDISTYYHWEPKEHEEISPNTRIDGILFDEAPSTATEENVMYMAKAAELVRRLAGSHHRPWNITSHTEQGSFVGNIAPADHQSLHDKHCTVIYNPGTPPSSGSPFFDSSTQADYIVIFEQTLETWPNLSALQAPISSTSMPSMSDSLASSLCPCPSDPSSSSTPTSVLPSSDQHPENREYRDVNLNPGKEYIFHCLQSLSPLERAQSIAIAHSVSSLDMQLKFASQAVEYGVAGHFATSTADYASWGTFSYPSPDNEAWGSKDAASHYRPQRDQESNSGLPWTAYVAAAHRLSQHLLRGFHGQGSDDVGQ